MVLLESVVNVNVKWLTSTWRGDWNDGWRYLTDKLHSSHSTHVTLVGYYDVDYVVGEENGTW